LDLTTSARAQELAAELEHFLSDHVHPAEPAYYEEIRASGDPHHVPDVLRTLQDAARERGLWNLFLPHATRWSTPMNNLDYAALAELTGRSFLAPEVLNCSPPDAGNMELLARFGTPEQQETWLQPLLDAEIRSCFAMTEPDVASSDATNIALEMRVDGADLVLNGRKWWITGAADPRCRVGVVVGRTSTDGPRHQQHTVALVPMDSPGLTIGRDLTVFGYTDREGHRELIFEDVRIPRTNVLAEEGQGFMVVQSRLGPGRIHHCMRQIGVAQRALELMCERVRSRIAWGRPLSDQGVVHEWIALSRIEIDQARLLTMRTAWTIDQLGVREAMPQISAIKVAVLRTTQKVVDRAIQAFGAAGVGPDTPLPEMAARCRSLRIGDGPDEVHLRSIARHELGRSAS
jgi:acyl-CoA dehydrogenase